MSFVNILDCCNAVPVNIPNQDCPNEWGQIVRLLFQTKETVTPAFANLVAIQDIANWTPFLTSAPTADLHVFPTSLLIDAKTGLFGFNITAGAVITQGGGDDTTLGGLAVPIGYDISTVSITGYSLSKQVIKGIKDLLRCAKNMTVYFVNAAGQIVAKEDGTGFSGFNVTNFVVQDKNVTGSRERSTTLISFAIEQDYDTKDTIIDVNFGLTVEN